MLSTIPQVVYDSDVIYILKLIITLQMNCYYSLLQKVYDLTVRITLFYSVQEASIKDRYIFMK